MMKILYQYRPGLSSPLNVGSEHQVTMRRASFFDPKDFEKGTDVVAIDETSANADVIKLAFGALNVPAFLLPSQQAEFEACLNPAQAELDLKSAKRGRK